MSPTDAAALADELRAAAMTARLHTVQSAEELRSALADGPWDLVMIGASSGEAAEACAALPEQLDMPFLIVAAPADPGPPGQLASAVVHTIRAAIERRQQPFAQVMSRVEDALAHDLPLEETLTGVLEVLCRWLPCQRASVVSIDFAREVVTVLAAAGPRADVIPAGSVLPLGDLRVSGRYATGATDVVDDLASMTAPGGTELRLLEAGLRSRVGVPVQTGGELLGVLMVASETPGAFGEPAIRLVQRAATAAAVAIGAHRRVRAADTAAGEARALAHRLLELQEGERGAIALRLHDEASQGVATILLGLGLVERDPALPEAVRTRVRELKGTADGVLASLHRTAVSLRPASLDRLGLVPALRHLAASVEQTYGVAVALVSIEPDELRLDRPRQLALFRVVEEAVLNAARHADAASISLTLQRRGGQLVAVVEDDGRGFDHAKDPMALGLLGMRERVVGLGGTLRLESFPGSGTVVHVEVPVAHSNTDR